MKLSIEPKAAGSDAIICRVYPDGRTLEIGLKSVRRDFGA
jgi:hypothetical protein